MGMNLSLVTEDSGDIPGWDFGRYSGDRDFTVWMADQERVVHPKASPNPWTENRYNDLFRPVDIDAWRGALPVDRPNPDRLLLLFDILESRPDVWISISY